MGQRNKEHGKFYKINSSKREQRYLRYPLVAFTR